MDQHENDPRLRELASAAGMTVRDLSVDAIEFYAKLPVAARRSLRAMAMLSAETGLDAAAHAAGRAIVQAGLDLARQRGREVAGQVYPSGQLPSEKAVEREAVRLSREAWPAPGPTR